MPSYRPFRTKPWKARVGSGKNEIFLGYYRTKDEALCVEYDWGKRLPSPKESRDE